MQDGTKEFSDLVETFATLTGPNGCPWDRKQTLLSVRGDLLEECYELLEAITLGDNAGIREELGDVLSCLVFMGNLAEKEGRFALKEALSEAVEKLVRRHPHVFEDAKVHTDDELWAQWDRIKRSEQGKEDRQSTFDGIPLGLPALARTQKVLKKMTKAGLTAINLDETDPETVLGEELWRVVSKAAAAGLDAEQALRKVMARKEKAARERESACESASSAVNC